MLKEIDGLLKEHRKKGFCGAIYFANPNHFSGRVLNENEIRSIIEYCYNNSLFLLVDESQQFVNTKNFISFRKVLKKFKNEISEE